MRVSKFLRRGADLQAARWPGKMLLAEMLVARPRPRRRCTSCTRTWAAPGRTQGREQASLRGRTHRTAELRCGTATLPLAPAMPRHELRHALRAPQPRQAVPCVL